jgi:2,4'-dihydroxyacetophenone dioxygenase
MPVNPAEEATRAESTMNLKLSGGDAPTASLGRPIDSNKIAYQLPQPMGMVPDALIAGGLVLDGDEREWVPQSPTVWFKPLLLNVSHGYYINILRVRASGVLSRHRHHGPVHAFTLRGTWRYLELSSSRTMLGG